MVIASRSLFGCVVIGFTCTAAANADPIPLPTFTAAVRATLTGGGSFRLELLAPTLTFQGFTDRGTDPGSLLRPCGSCAPGETVDFSGTREFGFFLGGGTAIVDSQEVHVSGGPAHFTFITPPALIPPAVNGVAEVVLPLTVSGILRVSALTGPLAGDELAFQFFGRGTAGVELEEPVDPLDTSWPGEATLRFANLSTDAPIPEPTTLVLLATGAAVGTVEAWRRRRTVGKRRLRGLDGKGAV